MSVICVAPWLVHVAIFVGLLCWYWLAWCGNVDLGRLDVQQGRVASGSTRHIPALKTILLQCELLLFYFLLRLRLLSQVHAFAFVLAPMNPRAQPISSDPRETASWVARKGCRARRLHLACLALRTVGSHHLFLHWLVCSGVTQPLTPVFCFFFPPPRLLEECVRDLFQACAPPPSRASPLW